MAGSIKGPVYAGPWFILVNPTLAPLARAYYTADKCPLSRQYGEARLVSITYQSQQDETVGVIRRAYQARIRELRADGETDGVMLNAASEKDFWHFVNSPPAAGKGSLVLLDNGNLRALWKGEGLGQLGVQFLGDGMAEYVIFRRRPEAEKVSQAAGVDTLDGLND